MTAQPAAGDPLVTVTAETLRYWFSFEEQRAEVFAAQIVADLRRHIDAERAAGLTQVGWLGPYGLIPGGMDNDSAPHWRPVYVRAAAGVTQPQDPR